jgi:alpha-D-ribose 1-methylphosphonate 5-triphosphate diphosphatase PhnM
MKTGLSGNHVLLSVRVMLEEAIIENGFIAIKDGKIIDIGAGPIYQSP